MAAAIRSKSVNKLEEALCDHTSLELQNFSKQEILALDFREEAGSSILELKHVRDELELSNKECNFEFTNASGASYQT